LTIFSFECLAVEPLSITWN